MSKSKKKRSFINEESRYTDGVSQKKKKRKSFKEFNDKNFKNKLKSNNISGFLESEYYK